MRSILILFLIIILSWAQRVFSQDFQSEFIPIQSQNVLLYESPSSLSPVVRRLFYGEVIKVISTIKNDKNETWGKVVLSSTSVAYIQGMYLVGAGTLPQEMWTPPEVIRNNLPFSLSIKGPSEYFGLGLQMRYLPFARLGFTLGAGSVVDGGAMKGSSFALGIISVLSMDHLSPFLELGTSVFSYDDSHSSLRVSALYINAGFEWIFKQGYFLGVGINYNRSLDAQVQYSYEYAKANKGNLETGNYGPFNNIESKTTYQKINPLLILGYSF